MSNNEEMKEIMNGMYYSRIVGRQWCMEDYSHPRMSYRQLNCYYPTNQLKFAGNVFQRQWKKMGSRHLYTAWNKMQGGLPPIKPVDPAAYSYDWTMGCRELACCQNRCVCLKRLQSNGLLGEQTKLLPRNEKSAPTKPMNSERRLDKDKTKPNQNLGNDTTNLDSLSEVRPKKKQRKGNTLLGIFCDRCSMFLVLSYHDKDYNSPIYTKMRTHLESSDHLSASICYFSHSGLQDFAGNDLTDLQQLQLDINVTGAIKPSAVRTAVYENYFIACPVCEGLPIFANWFDVRLHLRTAHNISNDYKFNAMPIKKRSNVYFKSGNICVQCGKQFSTLTFLHQHWTKKCTDHHPMAHLPIEPDSIHLFSCPYCTKTFKCFWATEAHVTTWHKNEIKWKKIDAKYICYNNLDDVIPVEVLYVKTDEKLIDTPSWYANMLQ